jgi:hypothetical protein
MKYTIPLQFPQVDFLTLNAVKKFLLENGELDIAYRVFRGPISVILIKRKKLLVCKECKCIRRVTQGVFTPTDADKFHRQGNFLVEWQRFDSTCSNPLCEPYKEFLRFHRIIYPVNFSKCTVDGCNRTAAGGQKCSIHGGPDASAGRALTFEEWLDSRRLFGRMSQYEILSKLRFLDNGGEWLIDDRLPIKDYWCKIVDHERKWNDAEKHFSLTPEGIELTEKLLDEIRNNQ